MSWEEEIEKATIGAVDLIEAVGYRLNHATDYNRRYSVDSFMQVLKKEAAYLIAAQDRDRVQKDRERLI